MVTVLALEDYHLFLKRTYKYAPLSSSQTDVIYIFKA